MIRSANLYNEIELLAKAAQGDELAFTTIYNFYYKKIYTFSLRLLKSEIHAEEVVQETFLKIWLLGNRNTSIRHLESYLFTLAHNRSLDILRRQIKESQINKNLSKSSTELHNDTEEQIILDDTRRVLQDGITLLPQQQRIVYQLCHMEGLKYEEVAQRLQISPLTVKTHMQHALRFLRIYISKNTDVAVVIVLLGLI